MGVLSMEVVVFGKIVLEIECVRALHEKHRAPWFR